MTVDQYTADFHVTDYVEVKKGNKIIFRGTVRELQAEFYTTGQYIIDEEKTYQLTGHSHHIIIE